MLPIPKFHHLITKALANDPKRIEELYKLAQERQPQDCLDIRCPHRPATSKVPEWKHSFRNQLWRIAVNRSGLWHLKSAVHVVTNPPVVSVEKTSTDTEQGELPPPPVVPVTYTGDPFIVTSEGLPDWARTAPHFMDIEELKKAPKDRFVVPNDFAEFFAWKTDYVLTWVKKRLNRFVVDDEVEDWAQDLLMHLCHLPQGSMHRLPGTNGRPNGCQDVIETYDPLKQYGASERRFRSHINNILGNKFLTVHSKRQKNPVLRPGNVPFGAGHDDEEHDNNRMVSEEFVHKYSGFLASQTTRLAKQHDDRLYMNQFKRFVADTDPSVYPAIEALESTGTIGEAARFMGVSDGEFTRFRNRLSQLGECFEKGTPVPKQRRPYKKRSTETKLVSDYGLAA